MKSTCVCELFFYLLKRMLLTDR